ncbi:MAG: hypothetical protein R2911_31355 [Caldilineaceae bacterium]
MGTLRNSSPIVRWFVRPSFITQTAAQRVLARQACCPNMVTWGLRICRR